MPVGAFWRSSSAIYYDYELFLEALPALAGKVLDLEPLSEALDPTIGWQSLFPHAEPMTAPVIYMELDPVC